MDSRQRHRQSIELSANEIFVLGAAWRGAGSQYEIQKETLLSPGVIVPCLSRFKRDGLITIDNPEERERRQIRITAAGRSILEKQWRQALDTNIGDFDAVLKLCKVGEWVDLPEAVDYAQKAAAYRSAQLSAYERVDKVREPPAVDPYSFATYKELVGFHRLQGEEAALKALELALRSDL
jgi:DNA-binding PadR family transcriptional regulator